MKFDKNLRVVILRSLVKGVFCAGKIIILSIQIYFICREIIMIIDFIKDTKFDVIV